MKNKHKTTTAMLRLSAAALIGSFLLTGCPAGVNNKVVLHEKKPEKPSAPPVQQGGQKTSPGPAADQSEPPAKPPFTGTAEEREKIIFERLMNAALRFEKNADVSEFGISTIRKTGGGDHKQIYNKFIKTYPFIFHIVEDGSLSHNYNPKNENELTKYIFDYKIHSDFENYFKKFEAFLEDFYSRLREGMTDAEIAYVLHNALAEKTAYAEVMHSTELTPHFRTV